MFSRMMMVMVFLATVSFAVQGHACDGSKDKSKEGKGKTERVSERD